MFTLNPISEDDAARLRAAGGPTYVADSKPGYPCRLCLTDAEPGERLVLVSHDPFDADSPYRSASPIFLHADGCRRHTDDGVLPVQLTGRTLSVRGFDAEAMMLDGVVIDGGQLAATVERMFTDPAMARIHVHNASRGCWATTIERATHTT
jgi:hypothetical protein